jgi:hypothetical protein
VWDRCKFSGIGFQFSVTQEQTRQMDYPAKRENERRSNLQKKQLKTVEAGITKDKREISRQAPPLQGDFRTDGNWWATLAGTPSMGFLSPADMLVRQAPERRGVE